MNESIPEDIPQKQCRDCKQWRLATREFFNATALYQSPDGLNKQCKECRKAYRKAHSRSKPKVPNPQSASKRCCACEQEFPATLEYFCIDRSSHDCLNDICKTCAAKQSKLYRKRQGGLEARRAYRKSRASIESEYHKNYRKIHWEHEKEYHRQYRIEHKEQAKAYRKAYRQRPIVKVMMSARYHKRRSRRLGNGGAYTVEDIQRLYRAQHGRCYYCKAKFHSGKFAYHVDHIVPLSRGGSNDRGNIVLACPDCNLRKGSKLLHEWIDGGRLL